jgi:hypothetical protein
MKRIAAMSLTAAGAAGAAAPALAGHHQAKASSTSTLDKS